MTFRDYTDMAERIQQIQHELDELGAGGLRRGPSIRLQELRVSVAEVSRDMRRWRAWHPQGNPATTIDTWAERLEEALGNG